MKILLFTDGSVNTKLRIGYGAYLTLSEGEEPQTEQIQLKQFTETSSTRLELQTLLWAVSEISATRIHSYTDSQNIISLRGRRKAIEDNHYCAKTGTLLSNHDLYKQFYQLTDNVHITFTHVKGHAPSKKKSKIDLIFSLVDRAARNALRTSSSLHVPQFSTPPQTLK